MMEGPNVEKLVSVVFNQPQLKILKPSICYLNFAAFWLVENSTNIVYLKITPFLGSGNC